jgi:uncharacterized DUF497 family protein
MGIVIHLAIRKKLEEKHGVSEEEVRQCFANFGGKFLRDIREKHETDPPTWWFIGETNRLRALKVVFIARKVETPHGATTQIIIKTAFPPSPEDTQCFEHVSGKC